jgi:hypothetical protein
MNWRRLSERDRMRKHGTEDRKEVFVAPWRARRQPPPSKADLRAQAEKAFSDWNRRKP